MASLDDALPLHIGLRGLTASSNRILQLDINLGLRLTISLHPKPGTIVRVDLSQGFTAPEMTKRRPAIVLSPPIAGRPLLCTIVPLSTSTPTIVMKHHMQLTFRPTLPSPFDSETMWVKGDIVLTVALKRLRFLFSHWADGQRVYDVRELDQRVFAQVQQCVRAGLGL